MMLQGLPAPTSAPSPVAVGGVLPESVAVVLFVVAAVACVIAQFFIIRAVVRVVPAVTGSPHVPSPNRAMEIAWAILPAVLIIAVFVGAWRLMYPSAPTPLDATTSRRAPTTPLTRS